MIRHTSRVLTTVAKPLVWLIGVLTVLLIGAALTLWQLQSPQATPGAFGSEEAVPATSAPELAPPVTPDPAPAPTEVTFSVLAGGDVLPHQRVHASARTESGYDFGPLLAGIEPWVQNAGLSLCHMEVPLTPEGEVISGYPMFAAAPDLAPSLLENGWNGCSTASNHSVDRKFPGVVATLDGFDDIGLGHVGTARTKQEADTPQNYTISIDGIDTVIAHLSATYGTNGLPIPAEQPWAVQLIDAEQLTAQARAARSAGADLVLVSIHAGNEYQTAPTQEQLDTAAALAESGEVDLMIGHHAHVPQPMTKLEGGPHGNGMWVAYGLGNMISNQDTQCCVAETNSGLLLSAQITHSDDSVATVSDLHWIGVTVDRLDGHRVHAFADILPLPEGIGKLSADEITARYERVKSAVGSEISEQIAPSSSQEIAVAVQSRSKN